MSEPAAVEPPRLPNEEQANGPAFVDTEDQDNDDIGDLELPEDFEDEKATP